MSAVGVLIDLTEALRIERFVVRLLRREA